MLRTLTPPNLASPHGKNERAYYCNHGHYYFAAIILKSFERQVDVDAKIDLDFTTISRALKAFPLPEVDHVVGIATGGIIPASLIAHQINCPMSLMEINYRAPDNSLRHAGPVLKSWDPLPVSGQRILLVDEVSVSGKTMEFARSLLKDHQVITFVLKGKADYVLFPEIASCVNWPWRVES